MTDDAYLFLVEDPDSPLGVPVPALGELSCMETASVRAWLHAQGVPATSPCLRVVAPEDTDDIPGGAERLPVPLSDEELSRLRHHRAPETVAAVENDLLAYRDCTDGRDELLARALAAGVTPHRIARLTGEDLAAVTAAAGR
ncbi:MULTISPECIES: DUF6003 family protein [unclassified Streptomyces]|uniref:DUF6003 family protein n=1 Tax=unclassified Streptomyces TaxID=2593676 RepID=UPI000F4A68A9|nr:DUF6003 family protein [Streptomyces sp. PanSC9]ROP55416.1 hypothetical protein EDD94_4967 [Streptomyces sp. PanSC9]